MSLTMLLKTPALNFRSASSPAKSSAANGALRL